MKKYCAAANSFYSKHKNSHVAGHMIFFFGVFEINWKNTIAVIALLFHSFKIPIKIMHIFFLLLIIS
jgi:hypothetical protein